MKPTNNEKPKETILLLPAPKAVPQATEDSTPVGANKGGPEAPEGATPDRKYGENTVRSSHPEHHPETGHFLPGNSGKPPGSRHMGWKMRTKADSVGGITKDGQKLSVADVMIEKAARKAMDGDLKALSMFLDRIDGKVPIEVGIGPIERRGVREYTPEEQAKLESLYGSEDQPETEEAIEADNTGGNPDASHARQGNPYE